MDIRFCGNNDQANPSGGLCDEYRVSDITDMAQLVATARGLVADRPGHRPLLSLDDFGQARYTSGHAVGNLDLDDTDGADLSALPPECFEDGAHRGYLSSKAEFPIRAANFARHAGGATFEDACRFGLTLDAEAREEWIGYQDDPLALLDPPVSVLLVPAVHAEEALAAFPNGYLTSDLNPAHNAAVARHFRQAHGYELIGVGAAYLGLWRDTPAEGEMLDAVVQDLQTLYNAPEEGDWANFRPRAIAALNGRSHLWIRYVE